MKKTVLLSLICLVLLSVIGCAGNQEKPAQIGTDTTEAAPAKMSTVQEQRRANSIPVAFGQGGQIKMIYDRRQRPQSVYLNNRVHIVFNAGGQIGAQPKAPTKPMAVTYDPATREFSEVITLGPGKAHAVPVTSVMTACEVSGLGIRPTVRSVAH